IHHHNTNTFPDKLFYLSAKFNALAMRKDKFTALLLIAVLFSLFYHDADAQRRRHRRSPQPARSVQRPANVRHETEDTVDVSQTAFSVFTMYPTSYFISTLKAGYEI